MAESRKSRRKRRPRRINWDKYTDFRSRNSRDDLAKLCDGFKREELEYIFNQPDKTGLCPIHWASIHNRSDLIEFLIDNGARMRLNCKNKLLADGTTLHLAAMNGCIEAVGMLLRKFELSRKQETKPKSLMDVDKQAPENENKLKSPSNSLEWLAERDAEGQTPLMRSAAPRSKRLDIIRDLLRKNLWTLSARPAEMALFLISKGADWRETDSKFSMNLMHLAIVNDYDDIVNMLIVIDKQLLNVPARLQTDAKSLSKKSRLPKSEPQPEPGSFVTVKLDTSGPSSASSSNSSTKLNTEESPSKPLINRQEVTSDLISSGILPLQLAIVYGRLNIISLIWQTTSQRDSAQDEDTGLTDSNRKLVAKRDQAELRATLMRVVWSNKDELFNLVRGSWLKILLAIDLAILTLVWMPVYLAARDGEGLNVSRGIFLASYCVSLALAFRVIAKNPGYLPKNTREYFLELTALIATVDRGSKLENQKVNGTLEQRDLLQLRDDDRKSEEELAKNNQTTALKSTSSTANELRQRRRLRRRSKLDLEERVRLLCHRCRTIRKPRSRHCNYCNHCVQDFDHHCIYLGCCIGRNNRLDFLIMLVAVSLTAIYGTIMQASSLNTEQWQQVWNFIGLLWVGKYALIGSLNVFFLLRRASLGVTMYEEIRSNRIRKIFGSQGAPLNIMKTHKIYSTLKGSFWRHTPDRFVTGDLPSSTIMENLKEFTNLDSITDYFMITFCADSSLAKSMRHDDSKKVNLYKYM